MLTSVLLSPFFCSTHIILCNLILVKQGLCSAFFLHGYENVFIIKHNVNLFRKRAEYTI